MKEKKNIDRLYQEKFKDFEAAPTEAVWKGIYAKLHEGESKRPSNSPFWSRMAGIAAVCSLILFIGDLIFPGRTKVVVDRGVKEELLPKPEISTPRLVYEEPLMKDSAENYVPIEEKADLEKRQAKRVLEHTSLSIPNSQHIFTTKNSIVSEDIPKTIEEETKPDEFSFFDKAAKRQQSLITGASEEKFEVSTHAAPIYYGNFGNGSFIHDRFNNNSSQGEITYSYGIKVAYAVTDKIKIRSGISKVNMSYTTNGIAYTAVIGPVPISSITISGQREPRMSIQADPVRGDLVASNEHTISGSFPGGILNQKMGFIEVPVELEYNLINKRFELNLIGGASTLFLDQNSISLHSGSLSATGKANNLNQISFSTNIGLGLDYNLTDKFKLNLEPILKYQLNTFNTASSDSRPYYLGIYSGFSYNF